MADVVDAMAKACNSRCRITTLTVYVQLRIVSVRVEVYVVLVSHFFKVRRVVVSTCYSARRQRVHSWRSQLRSRSVSTFVFLLLVRYVPIVAKRSIWDQCKYIDDRPTDRPLNWINFERRYLRKESSVIRSTSCLVLGWDFRGRRIEWRYFELDQIQQVGLRWRKKCESNN